jgi:hypothetical protein
MAESETRSQIFLARLVIAVAIAFLILGILWYGVSAEVHQRVWRDIFDRPGGPMSFRFLLQPIMAAIAAIHDGVKDARLGRSPYLWTILTSPDKRENRLREGLIATARIILLGIGMDVVYQLTVLKTFYPGEALIVALLLAFIPYLLLRGPAARVARWWFARDSAGSPA